jgi:hypothetical protein
MRSWLIDLLWIGVGVGIYRILLMKMDNIDFW